MTTHTPQTYFTLDEAAAFLRLSKPTLKAAIAEGRLVARKSGKGGGGKVLIHRDDIETFVANMKAA